MDNAAVAVTRRGTIAGSCILWCFAKMLIATTLKMASIISAAAGTQLRRALPLFAASVLTRFDLKVTLNWISLSNISHAFKAQLDFRP